MDTENELEQVRVFIGSSGEVRDRHVPIIEKLLASSTVKVIRWDSDEFRIGGQFFLNTLLKAPEDHSFDFAIFIFSEDDAIESRGRVYYTPRDNVLFELGIFMSKLSKERTFLVAPKPWETKLKILSDLQGYTPEYYSKPASAKTKQQKLVNLESVLSPAIEKIKDRMDKEGPRETQQLNQVAWVSPLLTKYFKSHAKTPHAVKNFALDLGATWNIYHTLLEDRAVQNITIQTLMMDGHSEEIIKASVGSPHAAVALHSERILVDYFKLAESKLAKRGIHFECRAYSRVPFVHGFLLSGHKLLLTTLAFENGKMIGTPNPYWDIDYPKPTSRNQTVRHSFKAYEAWFDEQWKTAARWIWPES